MTTLEQRKTEALKKALDHIRSLQNEVTKLQIQKADVDLAIVGLGCYFPGGAENPDLFWDNLSRGANSITKLPTNRLSQKSSKDTYYGGYLTRDIAEFDADFFNISAYEANVQDPQQRLLLEVCWQALENGGIHPDKLNETNTGVYIGSCLNDYQLLISNQCNNSDINAYIGTGNSSSVLAGRLAYTLGLRGPAITCDTACSSSLVAVDLACQALKSGEISFAIVGGVNLLIDPQNNMIFSKAGMLSEDGLCKTFDEEANGYSRGEGCGVVLIKRMTDALKDNDVILALIKGSAVNQDGRSSGLTVPNLKAQEDVIKNALKQAKLNPDDIDVIEAHGTGTPLGDPIEVQAVANVFSNRNRSLTIGSVKTNIGHLEGAAGIAGLIKMILALKHQCIPKHINFNSLNPAIDLASFNGIIPQDNIEWQRNTTKPRRAGVSSFGFSGTNAHVILEEGPIQQQPSGQFSKPPLYLFLFSAKTDESLGRYLDKFLHFLDNSADKIQNIAYTLNTRRRFFNKRVAIIASSKTELEHKIKTRDYVQFDLDASVVSPSYPEPEQLSKQEWYQFLYNIAQIFLRGKNVELEQLEKLYLSERQVVQLPNYAFVRKRFWIKETKNQSIIYSAKAKENVILNKDGPTAKSLAVIIDNECQLDNPIFELANFDFKFYLEKEIPQLIANFNFSGILYFARNIQHFVTLAKSLSQKDYRLPLGFNLLIEKESLLKYSPLLGIIQSLQWEAPTLNPKSIIYTTKINWQEETFEKILLCDKEEVNVSSDSIVYAKPKLLTPSNQSVQPLQIQGTHLIAGGLGKIGLALTQWLINQGCEHVIILTRRSQEDEKVKEAKRYFSAQSLVEIKSLDITCEKDVILLKNNLTEDNINLKGIYHLAGSHINKPFIQLDIADFDSVLSAKVDGAKHLHELSLAFDLDVFVMFSSIASFLGSNFQMPYVAANRFLDELACYREDTNLPVTNVNFGPIAESGMMKYESNQIDNNALLSFDECFSILETCLIHQYNNVMVAKESFISFMLSFKPSSLLENVGELSSFIKTDAQKLTLLARELNQISDDLRVERVKVIVKETLSDILDIDEVSDEDGFSDIGFDSLSVVEIAKELENKLGIKFKPTVAFDYPNVASLTEYISGQISQKSEQTSTNRIIASDDDKDISIIGMSCTFPKGSNDIDSFWHNIESGYDAITKVPSKRFMDSSCDYSGGFVDDIDKFDADFFNISPREAIHLDPQQRLILLNTWHALESAGINPHTLKGKKIGVFIGISQSEYASALISQKDKRDIYEATGNALNTTAGRVAYILGTNGPTLAIDTACSSSLVAVHEACLSIQANECELAIVGGVNALVDNKVFDTLNEANMLSKDGRCKTFDADANGYVRSEGCGVVILQKKSNIKQPERIYANIKSSTINQDGASSGLTVPNGVAQQNLIKEALNKANLLPNDIDYIETHGTGTSLGDPIEIGALSEVFNGRKTPLIIGTVKTNLGHMESAAGIAGLIKTVLSLKNQWIPKHIHFKNLNPHIDMTSTPFEIPTNGLPWPTQEGHRRCAGVSSFGFSGTNAHVILEEARYEQSISNQKTAGDEYVFCISAKMPESLQLIKKELINHLEFIDECHIENLSYSINLLRSGYKHKEIYIAKSIKDLIIKLGSPYKPDYNNSQSKKTIQLISDLEDNIIDQLDKYYNDNVSFIPLPKYPFIKKSYWLEVSAETISKELRHPLLEKYTYSHIHKEFYFDNKIALSYPEFVKDHQIYQIPVIAGATYISMLMSFVFQILKKQQAYIEDMSFIQPLVIDNEHRNLQMVIHKGESIDTFDIYSHKNECEESFILHASGKLGYEKDAIDLDSNKTLSEFKKACSDKYTSEEHLNNALKLKLSLGPHFHWIDNVIYNDDELIAYLRPPSKLESTGYDVYPGLIDSTFQSMMVWIDDSENILHIPVAFKHFSFIKTANSIVTVHLKKNKKSRELDLFYYDSSEKLVCSLKGFRVEKVQETALVKILHKQDRGHNHVYYSSWQKVYPHDADVALNQFSDSKLIIYSNHTQEDLITGFNPVEINELGDIRQSKSNAENYLFIISSIELNGEFVLNNINDVIKELISAPNIKSIGFVINDSIETSLLEGYIKSLRWEYPMISTYLILADELSANVIPGLIHRCLNKLTDENTFKVEQNEVFNSRLLTFEQQQAKQPLLPLPKEHQYLSCEQGNINKLYWHEGEISSLKANEVIVDIKYTSLNFRDLLKLLGTYPGDEFLHVFEHAGMITAVGQEVTDLKVGDKVLTLAERTLCSASKLNERDVYKLPQYLSMADACSIPGVFLTAYNCLYEIAQIKKGDKILIHAASGGVGLAAIQLAQNRGAIVYATVSQGKVKYLQNIGIENIYDSRTLTFADEILNDTHGKGVDIILNCLTGPGFIESSLRALSEHGQFIEISKINIYSSEKMQTVRPDIKYTIFALDKLMHLDKEKTVRQIKSILSMFATGICKPLPMTLFPLQQTVNAFNYIKQAKHIGKVLLKHDEPFTYKDNKTYMITGGLGGVGQKLIKHLTNKGVKHCVITGTKPKNNVQHLLEEFKKSQLDIQYYSVDVSDKHAMSNVFSDIASSSYPLAGIFHLAGVLNDKVISNLDASEISDVLSPKYHGTTVLDELSKDLTLDCFVFFSSIASALGAKGQANYAAANAFVDRVAKKLTLSNRNALSINWGPFADEGMAKDHMEQFYASGLLPIEGLSAFDTMDELISRRESNAIIANIDWKKAQTIFANQSYFANIKIQESEDDDFVEKIKQQDQKQREAIIIKKIRLIVAELLSIYQENEIDIDTEFEHMGFDSLTTVDLWNQLQALIGSKNTLPKSLLFENNTIRKLSQFINKTIFSTDDSDTELTSNMNKPTSLKMFKEKGSLKGTESDVHTIRHIFLTGATGLLGSYILKLLLEQADIFIHCLVRGKDEKEAHKRICDKLNLFNIDQSQLESAQVRIKIHLGDIRERNLGLASETFDTLQNKMDVIVHAAAELSLQKSYEELYETNVLGTKHLVSLSLNTKSRRFVYISSYSVMGSHFFEKGSPFKENEFDIGQNFDDLGYQKTKYESEKIVREAVNEGLNYQIMRPGDIFGDSLTGAYPIKDDTNNSIFYDIFKTVIETRLAALTPLYFDITPVDYVARAIVFFITSMKFDNSTYHLTNPDTKSFPEVIKVLREIGYHFKFVSPEDYVEKVFSQQLKYKGEVYKSTMTALVQYKTSRFLPEFSTCADALATVEILSKQGINCPKIDKTLMKTLFDYCIDVNYILSPKNLDYIKAL